MQETWFQFLDFAFLSVGNLIRCLRLTTHDSKTSIQFSEASHFTDLFQFYNYDDQCFGTFAE